MVNQLPEPTAVHWHGIELESYYDGVAGYSGEGKRIAPAISPGGSFKARFTPPRSGTFIYHTHIDEVRQQQAGLSGPLLVVDSPELYDPEHDVVLAITVPRKGADSNVVLLDGSSTPAPRVMRSGQHYRLRFLNVHTFQPSMRMRILRDSSLSDGADLRKTVWICLPIKRGRVCRRGASAGSVEEGRARGPKRASAGSDNASSVNRSSRTALMRTILREIWRPWRAERSLVTP